MEKGTFHFFWLKPIYIFNYIPLAEASGNLRLSNNIFNLIPLKEASGYSQQNYPALAEYQIKKVILLLKLKKVAFTIYKLMSA
ncbi:MAG: hypothetical protein ACK5NT_01805 [Pyrinomonadaceae bacterium]